MSEEIREQKNFRLCTVGGLSTFLATACASIGLWLIATGDHLPGGLLVLAAAGMLYTAYLAFARIRPGRPGLGSRRKEDEA